MISETRSRTIGSGSCADGLDRDAFGQRRAADRPVLGRDGVVEGGIEGGLDADDLDVGLDRLRRDGDPGDQPAAADGNDDLVEIRLRPPASRWRWCPGRPSPSGSS